MAKEDRPATAKVCDLYLTAFSREPQEQELKIAVAYLTEARTDTTGKPLDAQRAARENLQDLIWALINTKEFQFNH